MACIAEQYVNENLDRIWSIAQEIHANPETAFEEFHTSELCRNVLAEGGFEFGTPWEDLSTGFVATYSTGDGPTIGLLNELDALPGIGHACGHNIIATSGVLAALAVKTEMDVRGIAGTVKMFGCPAEEDGGGKLIMLEHGAFDGVDATMMMHPTTGITRIEGACCSSAACHVTFTGKASQAKTFPEEGVNCMDAASLFHTALGVSRQQMPDDLRISCVIKEIANVPNIIPDHAHLEMTVAALSTAHFEQGIRIVERIARGIAITTGCEHSFEVHRGYLGRIPNATIAEVMRGKLQEIGEPVMEGIAPDMGGEDYGNVTRIVPGTQLFATMLPERRVSGHTEEFRDIAGGEGGKHALEVSSKVLAMTALDFMRDPELVGRAKRELQERLAAE